VCLCRRLEPRIRGAGWISFERHCGSDALELAYIARWHRRGWLSDCVRPWNAVGTPLALASSCDIEAAAEKRRALFRRGRRRRFGARNHHSRKPKTSSANRLYRVLDNAGPNRRNRNGKSWNEECRASTDVLRHRADAELSASRS